MKFKIEQIALCPKDPEAAITLLTEMGAGEWARDHVVAGGYAQHLIGVNEADLSFDYEMLDTPASELEILHYTSGRNWMEGQNRVSHLGMHCTEVDLGYWYAFFARLNIPIAQEVITSTHTNPVISGKRKYHYVIFDTFDILSVDIKFIVRHDIPSI